MKVTRDMVAKRAKVSPATVSNVLNGTYAVSEKSRQKVLRTIEELNYYPDMIARSMVKKESKSLMIVSNNLAYSMYGEMTIAFEKAALKEDYFVNIGSGSLDLAQYISMLISRRVDGIYFASMPSRVTAKDIDMLLSNGVAVACGSYLLSGKEGVNRIDLDDDGGMRQAAEYLNDLNHNNAAFINGFAEDGLNIRLNAFQKYYKGKLFVVYGDNNSGEAGQELGYRLAEELFQKYSGFTAVVCMSDLLAYGAMRYMKKRGINIPGDISVVGFEDDAHAAYSDPPLTTVTFDREEFGAKAVELLINTIQNKTVRVEIVGTKLITRDSVKKA